MPAAASKSGSALIRRSDGGWWFSAGGLRQVAAGITDRSMAARDLRPFGRLPQAWVEAGQVHGSGIAVVDEARGPDAPPVAGCDGLITSRPRTALLIRTADCLPVFFAAPRRQVAGLAHAGWRGLSLKLPMRMTGLLRTLYGVHPSELIVAIGPAIRSCCYEVGEEFERYFPGFVESRSRRRTCDLVAVAVGQLRACGIESRRIIDSGVCTACEGQRCFSLRREGSSTGRLTSLIMLGR